MLLQHLKKKGSNNHGKHHGIATYVQMDDLIFSKLSKVHKLQDVPLAIQLVQCPGHDPNHITKTSCVVGKSSYTLSGDGWGYSQ